MARILIVDDEPNIRELIATILTLEHHDTLEAANGHDALAVLESERANLPDLIVLDLAMPEMDGWHFLEELYARGLRKHMRVVIVTGAFDAEQPLGTGAKVDVLAKPFDALSLVRLVEDALERDAADLYDKHERTAELARLLARMDQVMGS